MNKKSTLTCISDPRDIQRDACGVGFIAHVRGLASHRIVQDGLTILQRLDHRGGRASDGKTGDGAGIMLQIPDSFFRKYFSTRGVELPSSEDYAVGQLFLPKDEELRLFFEKFFLDILAQEGLEFIAWRDVPVDSSILGPIAASTEPHSKQIFVKPASVISRDKFEWSLYLARKRLETEAKRKLGDYQQLVYVASFSTTNIVYKGLLLSSDISKYYLDLADENFESAYSMVHQRFSTNTLPAWPLAQPFRYICHNGEINTLRGNINWMNSRSSLLESSLLANRLEDVLPICTPAASDSAILDNVVEFLVQNGKPFTKALSMLVPEPWEDREDMSPELQAYYEYQSCVMEPWDGPAFIGFANAKCIGAKLDRNGLRPGRYWVTDDGHVVVGSEAGVLDIPDEQIVKKGRLSPGRMFMVDMQLGEIVSDEHIKSQLARENPYRTWLRENTKTLDLGTSSKVNIWHPDHLEEKLRQFAYSKEDLRMILAPMANTGKEPIGSMGNDTPLSVLSKKQTNLFLYFKQLFAQVTNPPIDAIREELVTSLSIYLGGNHNLLKDGAEHCKQIKLSRPVITESQLETIAGGFHCELPVQQISIRYDADKSSMYEAIEQLRKEAECAVLSGARILILSDKGNDGVAIPSLLISSAIHHHLIRTGLRLKTSLVLASAEPREVHHFCSLIAYGVNVVCPYLALAVIADQSSKYGFDQDQDPASLQENYLRAAAAGILKVMSKMGISTLQSYHGAQIFEAIGLSKAFVDEYFTSTPTRIEGVGLREVEAFTISRFQNAKKSSFSFSGLENAGFYHWRKGGEAHLHSPKMIASLQQSTRINSREEFKEFCQTIDQQNQERLTLRGALRFKKSSSAIPVDEVESVQDILKRFSTGAMSFGSISQETHETIAIAMNRVGAKSNSGEGGEDSQRFDRLKNGDWKRSATKQVASGRFGVTSHYLINADELQIKMAQGAKPGEGGQLPGHKVDETIAKVRHSTPGVTLISPPPHHDIYSIEDLAQLIYDLKNANRAARINVKLVSAMGVGTIAAGVAKAKADVILISGYEGGTGASPLTSIKHAGLPWELGLADAHKMLVENDLRSRVVLQTDGQLRTPRDIAIATMLGAEEWSIGTGALVVLGCIMMRKCHLNTCPVGIATQDPELRKKFQGKPEHLVNYLVLLAEGLREIMASLGIRKVNDLVGRSDLLEQDIEMTKDLNLDLSLLTERVIPKSKKTVYCSELQDHQTALSLDEKVLLPAVHASLEKSLPVNLDLRIKNTDRSVGTILSSEISKRYGAIGLPEDTIRLNFSGVAGQSFMAFGAKGVSACVEGEVNDYLAKGLSGAKVIVRPPQNSKLQAEKNIICGNTALYGATSGWVYICGIAGERFGVRNSGATAVVEGLGDHGCEYMTGGRVIVLGTTGRNFAAGMSGGIAYVLDVDASFYKRVNHELVELNPLVETEDEAYVLENIRRHKEYTGSALASRLLENWDITKTQIVQVIPGAYREALERQKDAKRHSLRVTLSVDDGVKVEQGGWHG